MRRHPGVRPPRSLAHRVTTAALLAAALLAAPGCLLVQPTCDDTTASAEGRWIIATVNGQPIPASGLAIPGSTQRLRAGALELSPITQSCGSDGVLARETGVAVATYQISEGAGAATGSNYGGAYTMEEGDAQRPFTLSANGETVPGLKATGTLVFTGTLPSLGGLTVTFTKE